MKINFSTKIIKYIIENPKKVLLWFFFFFFLILPGTSLIKEDFSYRIWHNPNDELIHQFHSFQKIFGNDDKAVIAIKNKNGIFNAQTFKAIHQLSKELWKLEEVGRVTHLFNTPMISAVDDEIEISPLLDVEKIESKEIINYEGLKETALNDSLINNVILDSKAEMTLIIVSAKSDINKKLDYTDLSLHLNDLMQKYSSIDLELFMVGNIPFTDFYRQITVEDLNILIPILFVAFTLILILLYRSIWCLLVPFSIIFTTISMTLGVSGYLSHKLNLISSAVPTILLTVAMADAIHIITTYINKIKKGHNNRDALIASLEKNFYPTLLTSLTTAIGFLSFGISKIVPVQLLGIDVAIGVCFAWITSYTLIPAIAILLPPKKLIKKYQKQGINKNKSNESTDFVKRNVGIIEKNRFAIIAITAIVAIFSIFYFLKLEVNMNPRVQFPDSHPLNTNIVKIEERFGSAETFEILIDAGSPDGVKNPKFLAKVQEFETWLLTHSFIERSDSVLNILRSMNYALNNNKKGFFKLSDKENINAQLLFLYSMMVPADVGLANIVSLDKDKMRMTIRWSKFSSSEVLALFKIFEEKAKSIGLNAKINGKAPIFHKLTPYVVDTFVQSLIIALISITLIMVIIMRSVPLGLLSLIPNIFPIATGGAVVYLLNYQVDMGIVIVASVCLGIAIDDSIHFLFDLKKWKDKGCNTTESLEKVFTHTFPSLFFTTILITIGFGTFVFGQYIPNARFGIMSAITLSIALIADFIILPAFLSVFYSLKKAKYIKFD